MNETFPLWEVSQEQQQGLFTVACVLAVLSLLYAVYVTRKERDPFPLFVFLGAGLAVILEPVGDIFTQVVYAHVNQITLFEAWGRRIPHWMGPNYLFFFCVPVLLVLRHLLRPDITDRKWWLAYIILAIGVGAFEMPGINAGNWKYYGGAHSPLAVNTYPVWVGFNNAQCLFSTAVGIHLLRAIGIRGGQSWLLLLFVPMLIAGTHITASLPVATATHSTTNLTVIHVASFVTIGLNFALVWLGLKLYRWSAARSVA